MSGDSVKTYHVRDWVVTCFDVGSEIVCKASRYTQSATIIYSKSGDTVEIKSPGNVSRSELEILANRVRDLIKQHENVSR